MSSLPRNLAASFRRRCKIPFLCPSSGRPLWPFLPVAFVAQMFPLQRAFGFQAAVSVYRYGYFAIGAQILLVAFLPHSTEPAG